MSTESTYCVLFPNNKKFSEKADTPQLALTKVVERLGFDVKSIKPVDNSYNVIVSLINGERKSVNTYYVNLQKHVITSSGQIGNNYASLLDVYHLNPNVDPISIRLVLQRATLSNTELKQCLDKYGNLLLLNVANNKNIYVGTKLLGSAYSKNSTIPCLIFDSNGKFIDKTSDGVYTCDISAYEPTLDLTHAGLYTALFKEFDIKWSIYPSYTVHRWGFYIMETPIYLEHEDFIPKKTSYDLSELHANVTALNKVLKEDANARYKIHTIIGLCEQYGIECTKSEIIGLVKGKNLSRAHEYSATLDGNPDVGRTLRHFALNSVTPGLGWFFKK